MTDVFCKFFDAMMAKYILNLFIKCMYHTLFQSYQSLKLCLS